jgi:ubiquitin-conjugating enzyme E2 variant
MALTTALCGSGYAMLQRHRTVSVAQRNTLYLVAERKSLLHNRVYAVAPDSVVEKEGQEAKVGRVVLESEEELKSTWEHRALVGSSICLMAATFYSGLSHADGLLDYASFAIGTVAAYFLSDLGTGIYHWGVDNYGDGNTPVFGGQIAAFQGHHQRPWTITEREFCNNVHKVFGPAIPVAGALFLGSCVHPGTWSAVSSTFLFLVCMSQQFHAWSHMKKSELPAFVGMAQDAGLLISRKDHGAHHKAPFDGNYCIVSGIWNPILDQEGDENKSFFRIMERLVYNVYGVEPRCWHEPQEDWMEEKRVA